MIDIFIAYITITILGILGVSLFGLHRAKRTVIDERIVIDCPVCAYKYIVDGMEKIHKCPQCNSLNKT